MKRRSWYWREPVITSLGRTWLETENSNSNCLTSFWESWKLNWWLEGQPKHRFLKVHIPNHCTKIDPITVTVTYYLDSTKALRLNNSSCIHTCTSDNLLMTLICLWFRHNKKKKKVIMILIINLRHTISSVEKGHISNSHRINAMLETTFEGCTIGHGKHSETQLWLQ